MAQINALQGDERSKALITARQDQWRNKAIQDTYEPGSTFKIITASMALEEHTSSLNDTFYCGGSTRVPGWSRPISCWRTQGHGSQTFAQAGAEFL